MKILHAPSNVSNISSGMAEGLRARGHLVEVWNHGPSPSGFNVDREFDVSSGAESYAHCLNEAIKENFDVFHFHGTRSLIPIRKPFPLMWDLPLLKALGKRIIFTFHGSDVRLKSVDISDPFSFHNFADISVDEEKIKHRVGLASKFADQMLVGNVLNKKYVPRAKYLPKPIYLPRYAVAEVRRSGPLIVMHATRRRETKGTDMILQAVENLSMSGLSFEFRLVEGLSHAKALEEVSRADVVIEKVVSGDAGVLALEALAMGKLVMSRIRDEVYRVHPKMPVINVNPHTIEEELRRVLSNRDMVLEVASRGRSYVEENHCSQMIAQRLEELYLEPIRKPQLVREWSSI